MNNIFVYGTLKSGYHNNRIIKASKKSRLVCVAMTQHDMLFSNQGIPFLVDINRYEDEVDNGYGARVIGEVWSVDDDVLSDMDRLEGHPHGYTREPIVVLDYFTGTPHEDCEAYYYHHPIRLTPANYKTDEDYYHVWPQKD